MDTTSTHELSNASPTSVMSGSTRQVVQSGPNFHAESGEYTGSAPVTESPFWSSIVRFTGPVSAAAPGAAAAATSSDRNRAAAPRRRGWRTPHRADAPFIDGEGGRGREEGMGVAKRGGCRKHVPEQGDERGDSDDDPYRRTLPAQFDAPHSFGDRAACDALQEHVYREVTMRISVRQGPGRWFVVRDCEICMFCTTKKPKRGAAEVGVHSAYTRQQAPQAAVPLDEPHDGNHGRA
jgi:hypothetical protein